ncbi:MAG: hypothetical protein R3C20_05930 [Planctomycetaceae bacterium]
MATTPTASKNEKGINETPAEEIPAKRTELASSAPDAHLAPLIEPDPASGPSKDEGNSTPPPQDIPKSSMLITDAAAPEAEVVRDPFQLIRNDNSFRTQSGHLGFPDETSASNASGERTLPLVLTDSEFRNLTVTASPQFLEIIHPSELTVKYEELTSENGAGSEEQREWNVKVGRDVSNGGPEQTFGKMTLKARRGEKDRSMYDLSFRWQRDASDTVRHLILFVPLDVRIGDVHEQFSLSKPQSIHTERLLDWRHIRNGASDTERVAIPESISTVINAVSSDTSIRVDVELEHDDGSEFQTLSLNLQPDTRHRFEGRTTWKLKDGNEDAFQPEWQYHVVVSVNDQELSLDQTVTVHFNSYAIHAAMEKDAPLNFNPNTEKYENSKWGLKYTQTVIARPPKYRFKAHGTTTLWAQDLGTLLNELTQRSKESLQVIPDNGSLRRIMKQTRSAAEAIESRQKLLDTWQKHNAKNSLIVDEDPASNSEPQKPSNTLEDGLIQAKAGLKDALARLEETNSFLKNELNQLIEENLTPTRVRVKIS